MNRSIAVLGGGLAGMAAAASLGMKGYSVTLIERRTTLGGRASAFLSDGEWVDNCQHVVLGCCTEFLKLLKILGTDHLIRFYSAIPFYGKGKTTAISPSPLPSPLHYLPSFLAAPLFSWKEKWRVIRFLGKLFLRPPNPERLDKLTILEWLKQEKQPDSVIGRFWELILVSTLNETLDRASAKYGSMIIREAFLSDRTASAFGVPEVPLSELYRAGADSLFKRYNVKRMQGTVNAVNFEEKTCRVFLEQGEKLEFDALISALPFYNLLPILPPAIRENDFFSKAKNLETSPILGIHFWFKKPFTDRRFGALPLSPIHWFFTHPTMKRASRTVAGEQSASERVASPEGAPQRRESFYVELVVSACRSLLDSPNERLIQTALDELSRYFSGVSTDNLLKSLVVRETRATFSITPGSDRFRLPQRTPVPNFYLAGDWTDTGWPATMEGAVRSGFRASEACHREQRNNPGFNE